MTELVTMRAASPPEPVLAVVPRSRQQDSLLQQPVNLLPRLRQRI